MRNASGHQLKVKMSGKSEQNRIQRFLVHKTCN